LLVETSVPLVLETMDTVSEENLGLRAEPFVVACPLYSHVHDENHYTIGKLQYVTYTQSHTHSSFDCKCRFH